MNLKKRAVSPLVATVLLIVFSLILGTITMNLGKAYIEDISSGVDASKDTPKNNDIKQIGDSLYSCVGFDKENKCINWKIIE